MYEKDLDILADENTKYAFELNGVWYDVARTINRYHEQRAKECGMSNEEWAKQAGIKQRNRKGSLE